MKAKLIVEGKEFDIEIQDPELQKLVTPKKTGYERLGMHQNYYIVYGDGEIARHGNCNCSQDEQYYEEANYYSSEVVAKNNARADKLMRQLRRFAVEHREEDIDWRALSTKYYIRFGHGDRSIWPDNEVLGQGFGMITFDSKESCMLAIDTFHDELIWYFTEYKDSL